MSSSDLPTLIGECAKTAQCAASLTQLVASTEHHHTPRLIEYSAIACTVVCVFWAGMQIFDSVVKLNLMRRAVARSARKSRQQ